MHEQCPMFYNIYLVKYILCKSSYYLAPRGGSAFIHLSCLKLCRFAFQKIKIIKSEVKRKMSIKSGPKETLDTDSRSEEAGAYDERNFVLREVPHTEIQTTCKLCFRPAQGPDSSLKLGPLYEFGYCVAHLYCLMFSAGLTQNGSDDEGINGFLAKDIVKEWRRGSRLLCIYCKGKYATLGCVGKQCKYDCG